MKKQRATITIIVLCSIFFMLLGSQLALAEGGKIAFCRYKGNRWQIVVTDENGQNMQILSKGDANDYDPSWSFDGKYIAFVSDRGGTLNVYIMDADSSNQHQVTKSNNGVDARERYPSFSPDGKKIVFTRESGWNEVPVKFESKLYTIDIDGRNEKHLADGSRAKWSPDGKKMVFLPFEDGAINGYINIIDTDGKNLVKITKGEDPCWSLDGKYIAFVCWQGDIYEIYKMDSDGNNIIRLTNEGSSWLPMGPSWSPDGKHIAFWDRGSSGIFTTICKIYKVSSDGGVPIRISEGGCMEPSWFDPAFARQYAVNPLSKISTLWGKLKEK